MSRSDNKLKNVLLPLFALHMIPPSPDPIFFYHCSIIQQFGETCFAQQTYNHEGHRSSLQMSLLYTAAFSVVYTHVQRKHASLPVHVNLNQNEKRCIDAQNMHAHTLVTCTKMELSVRSRTRTFDQS